MLTVFLAVIAFGTLMYICVLREENRVLREDQQAYRELRRHVIESYKEEKLSL